MIFTIFVLTTLPWFLVGCIIMATKSDFAPTDLYKVKFKKLFIIGGPLLNCLQLLSYFIKFVNEHLNEKSFKEWIES